MKEGGGGTEQSSGDKKLGEGAKRTPFHFLMCNSYPFDSILTFCETYIIKSILKRLVLKNLTI